MVAIIRGKTLTEVRDEIVGYLEWERDGYIRQEKDATTQRDKKCCAVAGTALGNAAKYLRGAVVFYDDTRQPPGGDG